VKTVTPIDRVIEILAGANYRRTTRPFTVASVPFEFAAVLVGTGRAPDLIVIVDTVVDSELRIRQKIDALGRALDVAGSRRPLTAVLVGPKPSDATLDVMSSVCRVLPVGTPTGDQAEAQLRDWLAVLLPLPLPDPNQTVADPEGELRERIPDGLDQALQSAVLASAAQGPTAVRRALKDRIGETLAPVETLLEERA
jgi:hypothetical protein